MSPFFGTSLYVAEETRAIFKILEVEFFVVYIWCFRKANQIPHHLTQMYLSSFHKITLDEKSTQSNITKELHKTKQHHHDFHRRRKGEDFVFISNISK